MPSRDQRERLLVLAATGRFDYPRLTGQLSPAYTPKHLRILHGYGVLLRIEQISNGALVIEQGALYPALFRLVRQGGDWNRLTAIGAALKVRPEEV